MSEIGRLTKQLDQDVAKADTWVNGGKDDSYVAKNGVRVPSIQHYNDKVRISSDKAEDAANRAQAAATAAQVSSGIFPNITTGLSATTNGQYFSVVSSDDSEYVILYKNNNGSAVPIKSYPSADAILDLQSYIDEEAISVSNNILNNPANDTNKVAYAVIDETGSVGFSVNVDASISFGGITEAPLSGGVVCAIADEADQASSITLSDGTTMFHRISSAVMVADSIECYKPVVYEDGGDIFIIHGGELKQLTNDGLNKYPRWIGNKIVFLSSKRRGIRAEYFYEDGQIARYYPDAIHSKYVHVIVTGQSLAEGAANASITHEPPFPSRLWKLSGESVGLQNKKVGVNLVPLSERTHETIATGFGRQLLEHDEIGSMILGGQAWGGGTYATIKKGGDKEVYENCMDQVAIVSGLRGGSYIPAIFVVHGEADGAGSNKHYDKNLIEWLSDFSGDIKTQTGQSEPVVMLTCQTSSASGYKPLSRRDEFTTPFLQLKASETQPDIFLVGPKYQYRYKDYAHILAADTRHLGEQYAKVFQKVVVNGEDWRPLSPKEINKNGNKITIDFNVPVGPLVIDTKTVSDPGHFGFNLTKSQDVLISSVELVGREQVLITCTADVPDGAVISYAFYNGVDYKSGSDEGARGCIRDSDSQPDFYDYMPLHNWCVVFKHEF